MRWADLLTWVNLSGLTVTEARGFNALPFVHPVTYRTIDWLDQFGGSRSGRWMINMMVVAKKPLHG